MSPRPAYLAPRAAEHLDALDDAGAGVVGYLEVGRDLDHGYSSTATRDEARHQPALVARDGTVLLDLDAIADLVLVRLVVRLVAVARADVFLVDRDRASCGPPRPRRSCSSCCSSHDRPACGGSRATGSRRRWSRHRERAVAASGGAAGVATGGVTAATGAGGASLVSGFFLAMAMPFPRRERLSRWVRIVLMRARSRRVLRIVAVSLSRFVKFLNRAWNTSPVSCFSSSVRCSVVRSRRSFAFIASPLLRPRRARGTCTPSGACAPRGGTLRGPSPR